MKLHKDPYKYRFIAGSAKYSTKSIQFFLQSCVHIVSKIFRSTAIQPTLESGESYVDSQELEHLKAPKINHITSIKSFDFSTLYTSIPHDKLKSRLASIIRNSFIFKNCRRRYKYLVLGHEETYFVIYDMNEHSDSKNKHSEDDIVKMFEFLIDTIFVVFAGKVFQQIVGIPMGTNCAPLMADIFLYSYEAELIQSLLSTGRKQLASRFNFTYRYIDDVLSIHNPEFRNYLGQMYPIELEIKDTTESSTSASYLNLLLSIERDGQLNTSIYDNVTISISISHIFHSWVAIFQLRPPMASLSYTFYIMPGPSPRMDVLIWGQHDFRISFLNRNTSRNVWNRHWRSVMVDTGILSNNMKFPSHEC